MMLLLWSLMSGLRVPSRRGFDGGVYSGWVFAGDYSQGPSGGWTSHLGIYSQVVGVGWRAGSVIHERLVLWDEMSVEVTCNALGTGLGFFTPIRYSALCCSALMTLSAGGSIEQLAAYLGLIGGSSVAWSVRVLCSLCWCCSCETCLTFTLDRLHGSF